jgi:endo-1,3-1,4-beta-glycanase ExoK
MHWLGFRLAIAMLGIGWVGCGSSPSAGSPDGGADGAAVTTGAFALAWQDEFDSFDPTRWQLESFTFGGNLAQFTPANATFANGLATLQLTPEPTDTAEPYRGVEMRSVATITYGKVESRIRFAKGSAVVSSLVLLYTPWPADNWNELDVEFLGRYSDRAQVNEQVYTGPPVTAPVGQSVTPTQYPSFVTLGFDPSADFHVYGIEWTPEKVTFTVDGTTVHTWSTQIARMNLPQNILLTIWASSAASWAGPIGTDTAPTSVDYDWVRVYDWVPDAP